MLHVALYEPEIPPNTGNIARTCAATDTTLHLIGPLGFKLDEKHLKRAGLDYWPHVDLHLHATFGEFRASLPGSRILALSSKAKVSYTRVAYRDGDCLLFGSESKGLPASIHEQLAGNVFTIPMPSGHVRCLNLATAAGIVLYEALRQRHDW